MYWTLEYIGKWKYWTLECFGNWNVLEIEMYWKLKCIGIMNVNGNRNVLELECIGNWNVLEIEMYWNWMYRNVKEKLECNLFTESSLTYCESKRK